MSQLFSPIFLRGLELPNRIVVAPMCQYAAEEGSMNDWHLMHLGQFALGGAGLVFTEAIHVSAEGRITPRCAGLWDDAQERATARVLDFCRSWGLAKLGVQLAHAGRKASCHTPLKGRRPLAMTEGAWPIVGPSALPYAPGWHVPTELDRAGMTGIREDFVQATERCLRLDVDVLELHVGHGYLLNQFFSPLSNKRGDAYGGSLEKRMRFPLEVFEAVRRAWPMARPLGVRISAVDWIEGGTTIEDTVAFAQALEDLGCDFIDLTSGGVAPQQTVEVGPSYQVGFSAAVKEAVEIAVMAVGMINRARQAEAIIAEGRADLVMLARGMMYDPRWAWHAARELEVEIAYPDQYVRCHPARWPQAFE